MSAETQTPKTKGKKKSVVATPPVTTTTTTTPKVNSPKKKQPAATKDKTDANKKVTVDELLKCQL